MRMSYIDIGPAKFNIRYFQYDIKAPRVTSFLANTFDCGDPHVKIGEVGVEQNFSSENVLEDYLYPLSAAH